MPILVRKTCSDTSLHVGDRLSNLRGRAKYGARSWMQGDKMLHLSAARNRKQSMSSVMWLSNYQTANCGVADSESHRKVSDRRAIRPNSILALAHVQPHYLPLALSVHGSTHHHAHVGLSWLPLLPSASARPAIGTHTAPIGEHLERRVSTNRVFLNSSHDSTFNTDTAGTLPFVIPGSVHRRYALGFTIPAHVDKSKDMVLLIRVGMLDSALSNP